MSVSSKPQAEPSASVRVVAQEGDVEAPFVAEAEQLMAGLADREPAWLREARTEALSTFRRLGFPHRRVEEWKYTDLRSHIDRHDYSAKADEATGASAGSAPFGDAITLTFVDGDLVSDLSGDVGASGIDVSVWGAGSSSFAEQPATSFTRVETPRTAQAVNAFNLSLSQSGAVVRVAEGARVDRPLHLRFLYSGAGQCHLRHSIEIGKNAQATILESHESIHEDGDRLVTHSTALEIGDGAKLNHYRFAAPGDRATVLLSLGIAVRAGATYAGTALTAGCGLVRYDTDVECAGEEANVHLGGAYLLQNDEHCDQTIFINHARPSCNSSQVFKGVLTDRARGVFQGKVLVAQDAQHTDAHQLSNALLLSDRAEIDAKPELEIYADDVKCSHGSTAGELDDAALFYMRSRGIPLSTAKKLLIEAFVREPIEAIEEDQVRSFFEERIREWLDNVEEHA